MTDSTAKVSPRNATRMSNTERAARESLSRKGFWVAQGKRAFDTAKRLEASNAIDGASYSYSAFNGNGHRSQWDHPRFIRAYEVAIRVPR